MRLGKNLSRLLLVLGRLETYLVFIHQLLDKFFGFVFWQTHRGQSDAQFPDFGAALKSLIAYCQHRSVKRNRVRPFYGIKPATS